MPKAKLTIYQSEGRSDFEYRWRLTSPNGRIVAASSEGFDSAFNARRNVDTLRRLLNEGPDVELEGDTQPIEIDDGGAA